MKNLVLGGEVRLGLWVTLAWSVLSGCSSVDQGETLGRESDQLIVGTDDRQDAYATTDGWLRALAEGSTAALVLDTDLKTLPGGSVELSSQSLAARLNLCESERFRDDPTPAFCSATLIDDDLLLTAAHCVVGTQPYSVVFNFRRTAPGALQSVTTADVFKPTGIVVSKFSDPTAATDADYAIVRLDRSATPRFQPALVRPRAQGLLPVGQDVAAVGFPNGIPAKVATGAVSSSELDHLDTSIDAFPGNSGSGVYSTSGDIYRLVGVLAGASTQPTYDLICNGGCQPTGGSAGFGSVENDPPGSCRRAHVCQPGESCFARSIPVSVALSALCQNALQSPRLCNYFGAASPPTSVRPIVFHSSVTVSWAASTGATGFIVQEHSANPWSPWFPRRFSHGEKALGAGARSATFSFGGEEGAYFRVCALGKSETDPTCSAPVKLVRTTSPPSIVSHF